MTLYFGAMIHSPPACSPRRAMESGQTLVVSLAVNKETVVKLLLAKHDVDPHLKMVRRRYTVNPRYKHTLRTLGLHAYRQGYAYIEVHVIIP
jgi:hypothetical protein